MGILSKKKKFHSTEKNKEASLLHFKKHNLLFGKKKKHPSHFLCILQAFWTNPDYFILPKCLKMLVPQGYQWQHQPVPLQGLLHNCLKVSLQISLLYFWINFTFNSNTANVQIHSPSMLSKVLLRCRLQIIDLSTSLELPPWYHLFWQLFFLAPLFLEFAMHCPAASAGLTCSIFSLWRLAIFD